MIECIYKDEHLLVVDKPAGISLLADRQEPDCLWDQLVEYCAANALSKPLQVHRLDKGTSGVLLVALSRECQSSLTRQFNDHVIRKVYTARVVGAPMPARAGIDLPLMPGRKSRYRIAGQRDSIVLAGNRRPPVWVLGDGPAPGKKHYPSFTSYRTLSGNGGASLLLLQPRTGRTHQLRVHLSWLGWPILGDHLYGKPSASEQSASRLMLHCRKIVICEDWKAETPARWRAFRSRLSL